ncbi:putative holin [Ectopseudomonas hydrolytica]|uniref:putative holin n=1 Tax=Ectopseudomonas hydrolytica TaxID=2493633 RepID=UPI003EDFEFF8
MSEPLTGLAVCAAGVGICISGFMAGVDGSAATGALCGATVFVIARSDLKVLPRALLFLISLVMGYQFSPALGELELWGIRPFTYSGPAAFAAAALVVGLTMAAIRKRVAPSAPGGIDG